MVQVRIGHFVEAQILEHLGVDFIDESEVLTPADEQYHIEKEPFKVLQHHVHLNHNFMEV